VAYPISSLLSVRDGVATAPQSGGWPGLPLKHPRAGVLLSGLDALGYRIERTGIRSRARALRRLRRRALGMVEDPSATERDESIASPAGMIFILIGCRASGSRLR
jgi:hypothetical protein